MAFSIFPYLWTIDYVKFCFHKNQAEVSNAQLVYCGWDEELEEHVVDFTVDVKIKNYDVKSIDFHILIYKGGTFIGHINTGVVGNTVKQIDGAERVVFEKKSQQTERVYLSGGRAVEQAGDLFKELYFGNPEDYTFEVNLIAVYFEDGTDVGHFILFSMDYYYDENGKIHYND